MARTREMEIAAKALGISEDLIDTPKKPSRSKRAPVVIREYRPSEEAQIKAISTLLRDAINTVPTDKRDRVRRGPGDDAKEIESGLHAATGRLS